MSPEVRRGGPEATSPESSAATTQADEDILANIPGYVVLLTTRYGMPRRKVYLDLGHARAAVGRAREQGQQAWLVLCELTPVTELDGEWPE